MSTEQTVNVPLDEKHDINFIGVIDRVIKGKDGGYLVVDYKTSKREKKKKTLMDDNQLKGYAWAIHMLYDVPYDKIYCAHYYCDWCEYKDACPKFNSEQTVCKRIDEQKELKKKLKS
jgi:RecB family exonuclease